MDPLSQLTRAIDGLLQTLAAKASFAERQQAAMALDKIQGGFSRDELMTQLTRITSALAVTTDPLDVALLGGLCQGFCSMFDLPEFVEAAALALDASAPAALAKAVRFRERMNSYGDTPLGDAFLQEILRDDPDGAFALGNLEPMLSLVIWFLSRSKQARERVRASHTAELARRRIGAVHKLGDWLGKLLATLEDERLIVIEPAAKRGFELRISGVADNVQLQVLLANALAEPLHVAKPEPKVLTVFDGSGPQKEADLQAHGIWNLYNWTGLRADRSLPSDSVSEMMLGHLNARLAVGGADTVVPKQPAADGDADGRHWIWSEGMPVDIFPLEGIRVVLLGPPAYNRSWNCVRSFADLKPSFECTPLSEQDTEAWLTRIVRARDTSEWSQFEVQVLTHQGRVAESEGNAASAGRYFQRAVEAAEQRWGPTPLRLPVR
jgi:hypothetical protein